MSLFKKNRYQQLVLDLDKLNYKASFEDISNAEIEKELLSILKRQPYFQNHEIVISYVKRIKHVMERNNRVMQILEDSSKMEEENTLLLKKLFLSK